MNLYTDQEVTARPALCKKPIVAMLVAHMAANNCFFILFNWLPAYFHTKYPDASASIYSSVPWSLTLFTKSEWLKYLPADQILPGNMKETEL